MPSAPPSRTAGRWFWTGAESGAESGAAAEAAAGAMDAVVMTPLCDPAQRPGKATRQHLERIARLEATGER